MEDLPKLEINDVLENLEFRGYFKAHLKKEWCSENMVFYEEIEEYKKLEFEERKVKSLEMVEQFFSTASILEINTSQTLKNDVLKLTKEGEAPLDLFDEIIGDLTSNMLLDSFKRFKKTQLYAKMFQ